MSNTGILYFGKTNLIEIGKTKAAELLNISREQLDNSPDYLFIGLCDGSSIGVDKANLIISKSCLKASVSTSQVCLIDHMEKMTPQAQNKLLKTLEESELVVIGLCYEDNILSTVKSRMHLVTLGNNETLSEELKQLFSEIEEIFSSGKLTNLFSALNLVKEKDVESFFVTHRGDIGTVISHLGNMVSLKADEELIKTIANHRERCMSTTYTKDDFFVLVASITEKIK